MVNRSRGSDESRLYVGNLVHNATNVDLDSLFSKFGKVNNIWVAKNPPGFAFITFDDPRDAKDAIYELNGKDFKGNSLRVERCRMKPRRRPYRDSYNRPSPRRSRSRSNSSRRRYRSRSPSYGRARSRS